MEPTLVAVILFTLAGLFAIVLIADKKVAESERNPPSNFGCGLSLETHHGHTNVHRD